MAARTGLVMRFLMRNLRRVRANPRLRRERADVLEVIYGGANDAERDFNNMGLSPVFGVVSFQSPADVVLRIDVESQRVDFR